MRLVTGHASASLENARRSPRRRARLQTQLRGEVPFDAGSQQDGGQDLLLASAVRAVLQADSGPLRAVTIRSMSPPCHAPGPANLFGSGFSNARRNEAWIS